MSIDIAFPIGLIVEPWVNVADHGYALVWLPLDVEERRFEVAAGDGRGQREYPAWAEDWQRAGLRAVERG